MSGIFGTWNLNGSPAEPERLERMSGILSHRGPDGATVWVDGPIGLGHRALHAIPESRGETQPLVDREHGRVVVADVRIDNREELVRALGQPSRRDGKTGDATLLLAAWARWGDRCVERLIGDFAFVVWDARERSLFCARDHFGVRPLYYHHAPGRLFAFASEIEALLVLPEIPDQIDEIEVARHLRVPIRGEPRATYHRHVRRLPPARILTVSEGGLADRAYWELDPDRRTRLESDEAYAEAFRCVFEEAVRCRLRSAGPVASMLSGGIDSAAITCMAAWIAESATAPPLHTLSAVYPRVPDSDERPFIQGVLKRYDVVPHFFEADAKSPIADIDRMNRIIGGPNHGTNLYFNWELFGLAREVGARVVLDGFDGDTTVSHGKGYLVELAVSGRWLRLARVALPYLAKMSETPFFDYLGILRFGIGRRLRDSGWRVRPRPARGGAAPGPPPSSMVDEAFAARLSDRRAEMPAPPTTEREMHRYALTSPRLLEALGWIEACGAGRGVEVRFPFFDVRLAEFCLSLPPDQKIRRGWSRSVLRRAMEGVLPPSIQWRPGKADLHPGWRYAMRSNEGARVEKLLRDPGPIVERYLDLERLRSSYERFVSAGTTRSEEVDLWRALSLALWLKTEASPEDVRSERSSPDSEGARASG